MTTAAKIEANRRNAKKSTGPRTVAGKNRSRFNALKHGMSAKTDVLPAEDPRAFQQRIDLWNEDLQPRNNVERALIERAARFSWNLDRADRAQTARLAVRARDAARRANAKVRALGRRLFWDPRGSTALYGSTEYESILCREQTSWSGQIDDPNDPPRLLERLESTADGCLWLLGQWAELRARLETGDCWQSPDKFKAIRLLGRQPIDAADVPEVARIFRAAYVLDKRHKHPISELRSEMFDFEMTAYKTRLSRRPAETFDGDGTKARQALLEIVGRETERVNAQLAQRLQDAKQEAALAADILAFDDSKKGERLERYEMTANRALIRNLDALFKVRRETEDLEPAVAAGSEEASAETAPVETARAAKPDLSRDPSTFTDEEWDALDPDEVDAIFDEGLVDDDKPTEDRDQTDEDDGQTDDDDLLDGDECTDEVDLSGADDLSSDDDLAADDDLAGLFDPDISPSLDDADLQDEPTLGSEPNSQIEPTAANEPASQIQATPAGTSDSPRKGTRADGPNSPIKPHDATAPSRRRGR
jgi:hypothetical protein